MCGVRLCGRESVGRSALIIAVVYPCGYVCGCVCVCLSRCGGVSVTVGVWG